MCKESNIQSQPGRKRSKRVPAHLQDSVVMETVGHGGITELQDTFRTEMHVAVIDCLLAELDSRFSANATAVMRGIQCLTVKHS